MTSDGALSASNISHHTRRELAVAGLVGRDSEYGGLIGRQVQAWADATLPGHSGGSIEIALAVFDQVVHFRSLSPLTDDPDEWFCHSDGIVDPEDPPLWQNKRQSSAFSLDGGKTFYDVNEPLQGNGEPILRNTTHKENKSA